MAEVGEPAAKPLLMRVQHATEHQFTARVDEFDFHAGKFQPASGR